jgi:hypothetical protein
LSIFGGWLPILLLQFLGSFERWIWLIAFILFFLQQLHF